MAALAVVIMTLGGLIPIATYVTPILCGLLLYYVTCLCGKRIGWTWYAAVSILGLLLSPDREAAAVFVGFGYYPIIKPWLDALPLTWLWKLLLFNGVTGILYAALIYVAGMTYLIAEFTEFGLAGMLITLLLGNVCFFLMDRTLRILETKRRKR